MRIEHPNSSPSTFNSRLLALWCCVLLIFATSLCKVMLYKYLADSLLWQSCINRTRVIGYYFSATSQPNNNKKHRTITPCVHVDPSFVFNLSISKVFFNRGKIHNQKRYWNDLQRLLLNREISLSYYNIHPLGEASPLASISVQTICNMINWKLAVWNGHKQIAPKNLSASWCAIPIH